MILKFDKAISDTIKIIEDRFNGDPPETTLVRDSFGVITVVLPDDALANTNDWNEVAEQLHKVLGVYSPGDKQVLLRQIDLIDPSDVLESPDRIRLTEANTWLVDRLLTNQDWLREPLVKHPPIPTAVAFSIKGGVGRTTAFALWAWSLARLGKNIILVDLDLEAPGVAGLLLDEERQPDYGLADWLVEALLGQLDETLLQECLSDCALASKEPGRIRVLPAFGKKLRIILTSWVAFICRPMLLKRDSSQD
jgi:CobQ/CobB/MinD/ParA nucleotide binding domain